MASTQNIGWGGLYIWTPSITLSNKQPKPHAICASSLFQNMGTRVYVGRLSYRVRERDVEKFFKGYGRVREILLKNGYGFVVSINPVI